MTPRDILASLRLSLSILFRFLDPISLSLGILVERLIRRCSGFRFLLDRLSRLCVNLLSDCGRRVDQFESEKWKRERERERESYREDLRVEVFSLGRGSQSMQVDVTSSRRQLHNLLEIQC
ncbi:uncharacterized protein LOC103715025 isoform X2 [Phoenix dactylifera]|uniref:Uncharacterized protein LOC103715025 isoform X2 n=1 Tax=Phoenix dactylifera TaxID=42345 RepID=A0A8B9ALM1_PHODC|nr:uncharacterized protein LOC103715025 isoform X2 [Phoenix dactylifera]